MRKPSFLISITGLMLLASFLFFIIWSVVPIYGQTLPHLLEMNWNWAFHFSAFLVSLMVAVLGVGAMVVFAFVAIQDDEHE